MNRSFNKGLYLRALMLATLFLFAGTPIILAQSLSPAMMQMASAELQKRGLTEAEVRARLLQKGIDVDNISPSDYANYQTQVVATMNELQAEKKAAQTATPVTISVGGSTDATMNSQTTMSAISPLTTFEESAAEKSMRVSPNVNPRDTDNIYGHAIFTDHTLDVFRTTDGAQAPDTYVLGEGDEVHISIFGASQTNIQQRIGADGSIQPSGAARIFLKGLTLGQARRVIKESLSASYLFRADQLAVTIITARTVLVNVFGETNITGGFTLSALNSALNALSAAGGPTKKGSVRNIQLIRGNTRKDIDLYDFMNNPAVQFKFDLQNNDIIFVPVAKNIVTLEGAVKRPMQYEMIDGENITDLIRYAGGLTMNAYPEFIQIQRFINGEEKLFEWNLAHIMSGQTKIELKDGDVVRIKSINKPIENYVDVDGSVYYPGRFDLASNPTLSMVLANAKPNYQAKTDLLFVERMRPDSTIEFLTLPFPSEKVPDFTLQSRDFVHVMNQSSYRDVDTISVSGHVRKPFKKVFGLQDRITVNQAIEYAGGLKESAYPVAYIFRKNLFNPQEMQYIRIELTKAGDVQLQAGDQLNIYDNSTYSNVGELRISGAVKHPSRYTYNPTMALRDLITNAGGFNIGAAFDRVEVFRTILSPTEKTKLQLITLKVDSNFQLVAPAHFTLQPYDQVVVRMTPEFTLGRTVEINGQVKYPGVYVLESRDATLSDIIRKAGGLLQDADPYGAELFRTYNKRGPISIHLKRAMQNTHRLRYNPILFEGDVINVNCMENTVAILQNGTRMAQYSTDSIDNEIRNVVFQGRRSAGWYIRNFAGGFQKNADRHSVTVTYPNNQMVSTKTFLWFKNYPDVQPGSIITLKMDEEKIEKLLNPKEKMDLETTISKSLTVLTSTLSVILLLRSL
jgi:protein involved in polysaccharide export with SLBB domain